MITLDTINQAFHAIAIKDSTNGYELNIDSNGYITSKINGSVVVTATELDIRPLTNADVVTIEDGGGSITVDGTVDALQSGTWTIDSITNSVTVDDGGGSLTVDGTVNTIPGGFGSWKVSAASVDTTAGGTELVATPLTGRGSILVQNLGSNDVYLKEATGVTSANGMLLPKGSSFVASLDEAADLFAIASSGTSSLRIVEYAA